ncbi:fluoride efflux transporter FluC [Paenibacillus sp. P36]|uniref:fluoride efflux transporter FluC n=1 Tax=Paenibacillus sp. P36 TaxID=3342538 RepID=UPI0038B2B2A4
MRSTAVFISNMKFGCVAHTCSRRFPSSIPYGTLTINLLACFLLGILMKYPAFDNWKLLIGTCFMRAFTTVIPVEFY